MIPNERLHRQPALDDGSSAGRHHPTLHACMPRARAHVETDLAFLLLQLLDKNGQDHVSVRLIPLMPASPSHATSNALVRVGSVRVRLMTHRMFLSTAGDPAGSRGAAGAAACSGSGSMGRDETGGDA